jgi:hypothetical protein
MPWFTPTPTVADPLPVQETTLRQGDRLSSYATVIQDEYGVPLDLTGARCYLTLRPASANNDTAMLDHVEMVIENAAAGLVSYDWQAAETLAAVPGSYDVLIEVELLDGTHITVPSLDQAALVNLRSSIASDWFLVDNTGALIPDGAGGFEVFNPLLLQDGGYRLLEDGTYLLLETS